MENGRTEIPGAYIVAVVKSFVKTQQRIRLLTVSFETFSVTARDVHVPARSRECQRKQCPVIG